MKNKESKGLIRLFIIALLSICTYAAYAQKYPLDMHYNVKKNYAGWKKGENVHVVAIEHEVETIQNNEFHRINYNHSYYLLEEGSTERHAVKSKFDGAMDCKYKTPQDLWEDLAIGNVLVSIQKHGLLEELRSDLEFESREYMSRMRKGSNEFIDPYLQNYIYGLIAKIAPVGLVDARPGNISFSILDSEECNAFTFSNGQIVITTGLLAALHTEDELVAILSHEIAHYVLDHAVNNVYEDKKRQERAEFWKNFAVGLAAGADAYMAANNTYHRFGDLTNSVSIISSAMASIINTRLGMHYNHEQENEADLAAIKVLEILGYNTDALSTALNRIYTLKMNEREYGSYFSSYTHPALVERINKCGKPYDNVDPTYEKMVSFAITSTAINKYNSCRSRNALTLVELNIKNGVATEDDYILKANCLLALNDDVKSNQDAFNAIKIAKQISGDLNVYKTEILVLLRLKKKDEAISRLNEYSTELTKYINSLEKLGNQQMWANSYGYATNELKWVSDMKLKLKGM